MEKIVLGIDISKEKIDVSAIDVREPGCGVLKLDYQTFENRPMGFRRMLVWARHLLPGVSLKDMLFCCETTGGYDRCLCDYLYGKDLRIWRESALQIKRSMGVRKGKDDKADSLMIAEYAMRNMDKAVIYETPDESVRSLKALFLYRTKLVREKMEKANRASHLAATAAKGEAMRFILKDAKKSVKALEKSIKECEKKMLDIIDGNEELKRNYDHIVSIKGVSIVNATGMIAYSNNFRSIKSANKMASYYGVASFREQSGTSVDRKASVKYYSCSLLRAVITQAAECTVQERGIYRNYYLRLKAAGKPYGVILNNIKNKLIHLVYSLVKNDMDYITDYENHRASRREYEQNTDDYNILTINIC